MNILQVSDLPADIENLSSMAIHEGHGNVSRLVKNFKARQNTFDKPGEALFIVLDTDGHSVGVAGLNVDPYTPSISAGRIRRLYIKPDHRRSGIASALVRKIEAFAVPHFSVLQLFTSSTDASMFYESLGYRRDRNHPKVSHAKLLSKCSKQLPFPADA